MKTDLDRLMQEKNVDILLVTGPAQHNPSMVYLTGGGHMTTSDLVKKRGEPPVLFHASMERDEAARTGLKTVGYNQYPLLEFRKQAGGDRIQAAAMLYERMFKDLGIEGGRMAIYGLGDVGRAVGTFNALFQRMPDLSQLAESDDSILLQAMATKDTDEVERIRRMGKVTVEVVGRTADFLTSQQVRDGVLVDRDGKPVTIGDVKSRINLWLAELGAENPEGTIFSIGRDAGVPHSSGNDEDLMRLGQTIVFDIFPCEAGGGYFYDFTRTWCLGYAPDEALKLYEDVLSVFNKVRSELAVGRPCSDYQRLTCELFEAQGHPTVLTDPTTEVGYVHSLGHGVGLNIHEAPWFGSNAGPGDVLTPGQIFTLEPGLYYPERSLGVRLEDTVWVTPEGQFEILADYPMDLVLPVK